MVENNDNPNNLFCSFCGKDQSRVRKLIAGPAVYICDDCVQLCSEIIEEQEIKNKKIQYREFTPKQIKAKLDDYVIEQEVANIAYVLTSKRVKPPLSLGLFGDWGSGKSFFMAKLKKQIEIFP